MKAPIDWTKVLLECKINVSNAVKPCLKTIKDPQPNLGLGAGGDLTKPADLAAETAIIKTLESRGISFTLVSEESGIKKYGKTPQDCYVTTDPIDGTTNFVHGLPFYASSIAISGKPELADVFAGMVVDLVHDETYMAMKGKGATRNGMPIYTSKNNTLDEAVIGIDFNAYKAKLPVHIFSGLTENIRHTRHFGANAPEVCFVAAGLTDAFIDLRNKIRTTDVAAGFLIVQEAGGVVTTQDNKSINLPMDPKQTLSFVASGNKKIHEKILALVKP